jgi:hypothetical protein
LFLQPACVIESAVCNWVVDCVSVHAVIMNDITANLATKCNPGESRVGFRQAWVTDFNTCAGLRFCEIKDDGMADQTLGGTVAFCYHQPVCFHEAGSTVSANPVRFCGVRDGTPDQTEPSSAYPAVIIMTVGVFRKLKLSVLRNCLVARIPDLTIPLFHLRPACGQIWFDCRWALKVCQSSFVDTSSDC